MRTEKYGATIRKLYRKAIDSKKKKYECPQCHKLKIERKGNSLWKCKGCKSTYAGGAYAFTTEAGEIASRSINEYSE